MNSLLSKDRAPRDGDWMQTYSGRAFWPLDPRPDEVSIEDIAHALAHTCRFGGHCRHFYSVAQHSVLVSTVVPRAHAMYGLLHDAAEAYLGDIVRPIKRSLWVGDSEPIREVEDRILLVILSAVGVEWPYDWVSVNHADNVLLATEARDLLAKPPMPWQPLPRPLDRAINPWEPAVAEHMFLERYEFLRTRVAA